MFPYCAALSESINNRVFSKPFVISEVPSVEWVHFHRSTIIPTKIQFVFCKSCRHKTFAANITNAVQFEPDVKKNVKYEMHFNRVCKVFILVSGKTNSGRWKCAKVDN